MQSQSRRTRPLVIFGFTLLIIVVGLTIPPLRFFLYRGLTAVTQPLAHGSLAALDGLGWSSTIRQSQTTSSALEEQLAAVSRELATARQELQSRQTADQLSTYLDKVAYATISASVIGYSPDPGIQSLIINAGKKSNLRVGQAVITGDGWMIGKIATVHDATSVVLLLTDAQSLVLASIQNTTLSQGVVRGERGLAVRMDLIPKNDSIAVGQTVVTSGLEPGLPPDLLIGTIASIEQRSGEVFQRARVTIPIRYGRVRNVAVILQ